MPNKPKRVIALGFFDGVHLGHGALLRAVTTAADRLEAMPCAFTFDRHPGGAITGEKVPLLSTVEDRIWLMRRWYGIQEVIVASFDAMQSRCYTGRLRFLQESRPLRPAHVLGSCAVVYNSLPLLEILWETGRLERTDLEFT